MPLLRVATRPRMNFKFYFKNNSAVIISLQNAKKKLSKMLSTLRFVRLSIKGSFSKISSGVTQLKGRQMLKK